MDGMQADEKIMAMVKRLNMSPEEAWDRKASIYANVLDNEYHRNRLKVIDSLIPRELYQAGKRIFDFGCGDAIHFEPFLREGSEIDGIDISAKMVELARQRLTQKGLDPGRVQVGGAPQLADLADGSYDAILCLNALAYLTGEEEELFYKHARRALKPGGYLIVTHSNELFDMFSLNQYTLEFFKRHLVTEKDLHSSVHTLLSQASEEKTLETFPIRENPLAYKHKLAGLGFSEIRQEYMHLHAAPPPLLSKTRAYTDTLDWKEEERWKLMFICSIFGSLSIRKA